MNETLIWKILFMAGFIVSFLIRYPHSKRNRQIKTTAERKTTQEKILLYLCYLGMGILPLVYVFTPLVRFADYRLPTWAGVLGVMIFAASLWLFWKTHHDLGTNWSVTLEVREEHKLITDGIYNRIRHPMYSAIWLMVIGQALLLQNYIAGLSGIAAFGITYFLRVPQEEEMMLEQFGDEYQAYMKRTGRIVPKIFE